MNKKEWETIKLSLFDQHNGALGSDTVFQCTKNQRYQKKTKTNFLYLIPYLDKNT